MRPLVNFVMTSQARAATKLSSALIPLQLPPPPNCCAPPEPRYLCHNFDRLNPLLALGVSCFSHIGASGIAYSLVEYLCQDLSQIRLLRINSGFALVSKTLFCRVLHTGHIMFSPFFRITFAHCSP